MRNVLKLNRTVDLVACDKGLMWMQNPVDEVRGHLLLNIGFTDEFERTKEGNDLVTYYCCKLFEKQPLNENMIYIAKAMQLYFLMFAHEDIEKTVLYAHARKSNDRFRLNDTHNDYISRVEIDRRDLENFCGGEDSYFEEKVYDWLCENDYSDTNDDMFKTFNDNKYTVTVSHISKIRDIYAILSMCYIFRDTELTDYEKSEINKYYDRYARKLEYAMVNALGENETDSPYSVFKYDLIDKELAKN